MRQILVSRGINGNSECNMLDGEVSSAPHSRGESREFRVAL